MPITRDEVVARSYEWAPDATVDYSQAGPPHKGARPDCSGYIAYCLGLPGYGFSTVNLPTVCHRLGSASELRPGDLIGNLGPGTGGNAGHVQLFIEWTATGLFIAEQAGGRKGPWHHAIKAISSGYAPWRFNDIVDVLPPPQFEGDPMHRVRSGAGDGSIYLVPGYSAPDGRMAAFGLDGPNDVAYSAVPLVQLPDGVSVPASGKYNVGAPVAWPTGGGSGGGTGASPAEVRTIVRSELDKTKLGTS